MQEHALQNNRNFLVRLKDSKGNVVYGSYRDHEDYVNNFSPPLGDDMLSAGNERIAYTCVIRCKEREAPGPQMRVLDTVSHEVVVDEFTDELIAVRKANEHKRIGGVDEWGVAQVVAKQVTDEGFLWGNEEPTELCPLDKPCRLSVTLHDVDKEAAPILKHDMSHLLRTCFDHAADTAESGFDTRLYDDRLLVYRHDVSTGKMLFVYNEPSLYFANASDLSKFWDYASKVMLALHRLRDTELVTLQHDRNTFVRKFGVQFEQFSKGHVKCLENTLGIPFEDRPETQRVSPFSISCVDSSSPPIAVSLLRHPVTVTRNFTMKELVEIVSGEVGMEDFDCDTFVRAPMRNRIMIAPFAMRCLFLHPFYSATHHAPSRDEHKSWIQIDLDNRVSFSCTCRYPPLDQQRRDHQPIRIPFGSLCDLEPPPPLTERTPLPLPNDCNPPLDMDMGEIVHNRVQGIAQYLGKVLRRRILFSDGIWYIWTGTIWLADRGPKFPWLSRYICTNVPRLLDEYKATLSDEDKALLGRVDGLHSMFCSTVGPAHTTLNLLQLTLTDNQFEEARRHRGYIAAHNGVVDLRSGILRPYRYDDYITERSPLNYSPCDCAPGQCFVEGSTCNAMQREHQLWVDERIREISGQDLRQVVWKSDDGETGDAPKDPQLEHDGEYWIDRKTRREFARDPGVATAKRYTSSLELAFENNGLANYHRFNWTVGYMLTGFADRKLFIFGYGEQNNGKTLVWENLLEVFEQYLTPMHPSTIFSRGGSRADNGPTPETVHVIGKRVGYVAEMSQFDILNDASMKKWAGRDRQVGRKMRSEMISFKTDLVAVVNGNIKPEIRILDPAFWDRFHLLYYPINYLRGEVRGSYPGACWKLNERPRNADYIKQFATQDHQEGLFNWAIRQAIYFMNTDQCPLPALVKKKIQEMKNRNNPIPLFVNDSGIYEFDRDGEVSFKTFYSQLKEWCKRESGVSSKVNTPTAFRSLVSQLQNAGLDDVISLVGQTNTGEEFIKGISEKYPMQPLQQPLENN